MNVSWKFQCQYLALALFSFITMPNSAEAHFIWLAPVQNDGQTVVQVYFGEDASPDDPDLLSYVDGMSAWSIRPEAKPEALKLKRTGADLSAQLNEHQAKGLVVASHDMGVIDRGGSTFRLKYYAKVAATTDPVSWMKADASKQLQLDVIPEATDGGTLVHVLFSGKAVAGSEVTATGPGLDDFQASTGESGTVLVPTKNAGLYSIRAKHVEAVAGSIEGKDYPETRHYSTLTLNVSVTKALESSRSFAPIQKPVTSFGGAMLGGSLYIYGGHTGSAHAYSHKEQGHTLEKLDLESGKWTTITAGPHLQGLALVAAGNQLYRVGGFTAKNAEGEEHDLWSQSSVAAIDPAEGKWMEMPALPEPRSSFDAAVLNGKIYVIGGWNMAGEAESVWHRTAWMLDTNATSPEWVALSTPPFQRRAMAVAAYQGKIYTIGGMQEEGRPTRRVDIFDPVAGTWSTGPEIVGEDAMTGFGASAFATGGHLYVSTIKGDLQRLAADGKAWEIIGKTPTPRFFHRMLPVDDDHLLVVGGASMEIGKFEEVEILPVR